MVERRHVLVVEDDPIARTAISAYFDRSGFRVSEVGHGEEMWQTLDRARIDLIILDLALPGEDGFALLRDLRRSSEVAVIIVSGNTDSIDCVLGLELGANDYVTKPFEPRELLARAKNLIRLTRTVHDNDVADRRLQFDGWTLDHAGRRLTAPSGEDVRLTRAEFDLLAALAGQAGRVMTRDQLLEHISDRQDASFDRTIDVLIGRLRKKIEREPKDPRRLITIRGVGYMFSAG